MAFHLNQTFVYGEQPSATKMQYIWDNDYALADGSGFEDDAIETSHILANTIEAIKLASEARWMEELGRTTLASPGDTITINPITAKKYLLVLGFFLPTGGTLSIRLRFNNDSGNNYAYRSSIDGGADSTTTSTSSSVVDQSNANVTHFTVCDIINVANQEKQVVEQIAGRGTAGAGNAPNRREIVAKWSNTSDQITRIDCINQGTGDFATGSEVVVLGHD